MHLLHFYGRCMNVDVYTEIYIKWDKDKNIYPVSNERKKSMSETMYSLLVQYLAEIQNMFGSHLKSVFFMGLTPGANIRKNRILIS